MKLQNAQRVFWVFKANVFIFLVISFYASWKFLLWLGNLASHAGVFRGARFSWRDEIIKWRDEKRAPLKTPAWEDIGNFGPATFWGFVWSPSDFWGVLIFAPIRSSLSLEIRSTPSGLELSWKGCWIFHTFHPKLIYIFLIGNCVGQSNENLLNAIKCI